MKLSLVYALALSSLTATAAQATDFTAVLQTYLDTEVSTWAASPEIVAALKAQNAVTADFDQAKIDALDAEWRATVASPDTPIIADVLNDPLSDYLRGVMMQAGGQIAEIIVMDAKGLNAGITGVTSDYWQGDEAKHQKTYGAGANGQFVDEVEFDESTQSYVGQVSVVVVDPESGAPIGAVTVGVDAESLL
ncbi:hypothetical protein AQS8620_01995 [Aquimixticola soesokkakensis]|uniref:Uncharacterized protein n=1 Tax=Aquimixticola soesokkakensis TaxID=1519096 RepID=A0A1Y5STX8_9RHOB|nr:hypothetical protein [Aquimixticola soesokkakensis]SLN48011.1 hypothetical protein AQS8620_01995 [Aquimixticola soesokkakensis]